MNAAWRAGMAAALLLAACSSEREDDGGVDASAPPDAGSASIDAGSSRDGGGGDADAGSSIDSGAPDAGSADAGGADAGLADSLPACAALLDRVARHDLASVSAFTLPRASAAAALERLVGALASGVPVEPADLAAAGYEGCRGQGAEATLAGLFPAGAPAGAPLVVVRTGAARPWILSVPHPLFEGGTRPEGIAMLTGLDARALVIAGAHRCTSPTPSRCDGVTGVCGASAPYRISDAAHEVGALFHRAHVALATAHPRAVTVSLHGKGADGLTLSDGTRGATMAGSLVADLARELSLRFSDVTSCNAGAGVPTTTSLCGTTNVQGRLQNGSADACEDPAAGATGRFIHLEQSRAVRSAPAAVVAAFVAAVP